MSSKIRAATVPSTTSLRQAALRHLTRYAVTEAELVRVLDRKVQRWARQTEGNHLEVEPDVTTARATARQVARSLVDMGLINDALFAAARAVRLTRSGRSRQAIAAHLAEKGVRPETAQVVLPDLEQEVSAALAYSRRRRLGPFRVERDPGAMSPELIRRELGALSRAGFSREVAERVLRTPRDAAQARVAALNQP